MIWAIQRLVNLIYCSFELQIFDLCLPNYHALINCHKRNHPVQGWGSCALLLHSTEPRHYLRVLDRAENKLIKGQKFVHFLVRQQSYDLKHFRDCSLFL